jgi:hypothetical protein
MAIDTPSFKLPDAEKPSFALNLEGVHYPAAGEKMQLAQLNENDMLSRFAGGTHHSHDGQMDRHPFLHAVRRHWSGREQASEDARALSTVKNSDFVERINDDSRVGPHLEVAMFVPPFLLKGTAKSVVIGLLGAHMGTRAKVLGIAAGWALGAVGGGYVAYEASEAMESSVKLKAYDERFNQFKKGSVITDDSDPTPLGLSPSITQGFGWERDIPGVRDIIDNSKDWFKEFPAVFHPRDDFTQRRHDFIPKERQHELDTYNKVLTQRNLTDDQFRDWATKETEWTTKGLIAHNALFEVPALIGAGFVAREFGLGRKGTGLLMAAGVLGGYGLHWLGYKANHDTELANLYTARLLSKPEEHPRT